MPRIDLTPVAAPNPYDVVPATTAFAAGDAVNGNAFPHTGRELLLVENTGAGARSVTVKSVADSRGRTGDSTKSLAAGERAVFQLFPAEGWRQADGKIWVDVAHAEVKLAVVRLP